MNPVVQKRTWRIEGHLLVFCLLPSVLAGCNQGPPAANSPPVANAGADQVVDAGANVTLDGSGSSDPNGDEITYSWKQTLGTTVSLSSASASVVPFTAPAKGTTLVFELTVSDGQSSAVGTVHVSVRQVEESAQVEERLQRSITEDPAAMGNFPNGWLVTPTTDVPMRPPEEGEIGEFTEQYDTHKVLFAPLVEEDLPPGATRTVELQLVRPSGLTGSARWVGTISPLDVTIALDGSTLATGTAYHFGANRGGSLLSAQTTKGGRVTMSVVNTSDVTVKVRIVFGSSAL
jgi:hypothetical protein